MTTLKKALELYGDRNPFAKAANLGLVLIESDDFHIQVDLDTKEALAEFPKKLKDLDEKNPGLIYLKPLLTTSNGGNSHAYVKLKKAAEANRRVMLALELGSDQVREGLALARLAEGKWPVCLFETASESVKVRTFLKVTHGD